jgi:hypothetical protein
LHYSAAPTILRINFSTSSEQQLNNVGASLTCGDVKSGAAVNISEIDVTATV